MTPFRVFRLQEGGTLKFEIVRQQILADADRQYQAFKAELEKKKGLSKTKTAELLRDKFAEIQTELDQHQSDSRLWKLANRCIYGTDANDRMARTSKMNMIMHGDEPRANERTSRLFRNEKALSNETGPSRIAGPVGALAVVTYSLPQFPNWIS